jgi:opacity protein-like surface antigen
MKVLQIYVLIALIGIIETNARAQKTAIGIDFAPSFTKPRGYPENFEVPFAFAYGFGLSSILNLNSKMFLKTGIGFKLKNTVNKNLVDSRNLFDSNGNLNYDHLENYDVSTNYYYWNLPILLNYKLSKTEDAKTIFYVSGGMEINYLYKVKTTLHFFDGDQVYSSTPDKTIFNLSFDIGTGVHFDISDRMLLLLEPKYCYDFYTSTYGLKFHTLQLNVGLYYKLK